MSFIINHYGPPKFFFGPLLKKFAHHWSRECNQRRCYVNEKLLTGARATCLVHLNILLFRGIGIFVGECGGGSFAGGGFIADSHVPQAASFSAVFKYKWTVN